MQPVSLDLLNKYNVAIPRYTSYPTVPFWDETIDSEHWERMFVRRFEESNEQEGISVYIHLPFCEKLCTFCGCNKRITTNHSVEDEYIDVLLQEWNLYRKSMSSKPVIRELHIGGGTPTFFSPQNLQRMLQGILVDSIVPKIHEFGFEGHPNNTTREHLQTLFELGFNRVSFGMQDSNPQVQDAISMRPDRIAFYSYAHVPWTSKAQRLFDENDLPEASEKMQLYQKGKELFRAAGYTDIGMDHFALPSDLMVKAHNEGTLLRNFMGYTVQQTGLLLGLGVSSISDIYYGFAQNKKTIQEYYQQIHAGELAVLKGYFLSQMDQKMRQYILDIACQGKTHFHKEDLEVLRPYTFHELDELAIDDLVTWGEHGVIVTDLGKHFIRNICKVFDLKLLATSEAAPQFSRGV